MSGRYASYWNAFLLIIATTKLGFQLFIQEGGSGSDVEMRSEGSESGPDSPGTDAATAGSRSGAGSPPPTTHDGSPHGSPRGMDGCVFFP